MHERRSSQTELPTLLVQRVVADAPVPVVWQASMVHAFPSSQRALPPSSICPLQLSSRPLQTSSGVWQRQWPVLQNGRDPGQGQTGGGCEQEDGPGSCACADPVTKSDVVQRTAAMRIGERKSCGGPCMVGARSGWIRRCGSWILQNAAIGFAHLGSGFCGCAGPSASIGSRALGVSEGAIRSALPLGRGRRPGDLPGPGPRSVGREAPGERPPRARTGRARPIDRSGPIGMAPAP